MATVGISLGSNLGDRLAHLQIARSRLAELSEGSAFRVSGLYETDPVDCLPGDPAFLNAVVEIETSRTPEEILQICQALEKELGRPAEREQNSPRPLDLDLLYYDELVLERPELTLPHPRMRERGFVLLPLSEIRPDLVSESEREQHREGVVLVESRW